MQHKTTLFLLVLGLFVALCVLPVYGEETVTVSGKIESVTFEPFAPMKGKLVIKGPLGKQYVVYVGIKTVYKPLETPVAGDKVTVECIKVKGRLAARVVRFKN